MATEQLADCPAGEQYCVGCSRRCNKLEVLRYRGRHEMTERILAFCEQSAPTDLLVLDFEHGIRQINPVGLYSRVENYGRCGQQIRHPPGLLPGMALAAKVVSLEEGLKLGYFPDPAILRWLEGCEEARQRLSTEMVSWPQEKLRKLLSGECVAPRHRYDENMTMKTQVGYQTKLPSAWSRFFRAGHSEVKDSLAKALNMVEVSDCEVGGAMAETPVVPINPDDCFKAFDLVSPDSCNVVILAQDPYANRNHAMGVAFSVPDGEKHPASLANIFKEMNSDIGLPPPASGNLTRWANQGVLLANVALTTIEGTRGAHKKYWQQFAEGWIKALGNDGQPRVWVLWGNDAKDFEPLISADNRIISSGHPSPLSAARYGFFGSKPFSRVNELLIELGKPPINW